jgi:hypothetical protein
MGEIPRKKSPRAPSLSLDDALSRLMKIYDREGLHAAPTEIVAQHMGYKSANNGAALGTLASLRYFGLLERPKDGLLAVAKDVQSYKFAPDEKMKRSLLLGFLKRPALYNELLEKYESGLPSDANLKFELIQRGFAPQAAEAAVAVFKKSLLFADYYGDANDVAEDGNVGDSQDALSSDIESQQALASNALPATNISEARVREVDDTELDRIPVRLPGGRRAWLLIPTPFFNADRDRLKSQIDLLLTKEDEASSLV